jgi:Pyruvate/2-oxoacid:ferredoxin oxidoreductase delta subunit
MGKHLNVKGFYPATYTGGKCTACKACALICPDICIEVFR